MSNQTLLCKFYCPWLSLTGIINPEFQSTIWFCDCFNITEINNLEKVPSLFRKMYFNEVGNKILKTVWLFGDKIVYYEN